MASPADVLDSDGNALAVVPRDLPDTVVVTRAPALVLAEARGAAKALIEVINAKPHRLMFGDEQYIENEDWQLIGRFYGVTAKTVDDRFVTFGTAKGWEATAVATDRTGREIARATSMCLDDEEHWRARPRYEWVYVLRDGSTAAEDPGKAAIVWEDNPKKPGTKRPKKQRVQLGMEPVPLFQLRSMAATRAHSKALSQVLKFVPVLAGYRSTPAEELNVERVENVVAPAPAAAPVQTANLATAITAPQRARLFAIAADVGWTKDELKAWLVKTHNLESTSSIDRADYERIIAEIQAGGTTTPTHD